MRCRPRKLFQEIGQKIGISWFRQPRARLILVREPDKAMPAPMVVDIRSERIARAWDTSEFTRLQ
jgi:hypothetical protein